MLTTIYARVWVHEWVSVGGWFYIGVSLVSCVHSLILLNNSVQVYVISALELKFGHRNGVSAVGVWFNKQHWVWGGWQRCRIVVGKVSRAHRKSRWQQKVQNVSIQRSIVKNQWGEMDMLPNSRIHNTLKLKLWTNSTPNYLNKLNRSLWTLS